MLTPEQKEKCARLEAKLSGLQVHAGPFGQTANSGICIFDPENMNNHRAPLNPDDPGDLWKWVKLLGQSAGEYEEWRMTSTVFFGRDGTWWAAGIVPCDYGGWRTDDYKPSPEAAVRAAVLALAERSE